MRLPCKAYDIIKSHALAGGIIKSHNISRIKSALICYLEETTKDQLEVLQQAEKKNKRRRQ
jgi:hypothetical protein